MELPRSSTWLAWVSLLFLTTSYLPSSSEAGLHTCLGDCNYDDEVTIDDLQVMVAASLGLLPVDTCENADANQDGAIDIVDIVVAVNKVFQGCDYAPCFSACGDGRICFEECDDGGRCIGGRNAGSPCRFDFDCDQNGPGVCTGGLQPGYTCLSYGDCPGGECARCVPFGGDGCAANCTTETTVRFDLMPGTVIGGEEVSPGTSGATVYGEIIPQLPLPLSGTLTLTIGKSRNGGPIPAVIKTDSVDIPQIPVSNIACACVRAAEARTCGGTLVALDRVTPTIDCTAEDNCAARSLPACTAVHGPGNSASGWLACQGMKSPDVQVTQDCNGEAGATPHPPLVEIAETNQGASAILLFSLQLGTQVGPCTRTFCTDADAPQTRGPIRTLPITTGVADVLLSNANDFPGSTIGPRSVMGAPFDCTALQLPTPRVSGAALVGAFTACDEPTIADIVTTIRLVAR